MKKAWDEEYYSDTILTVSSVMVCAHDDDISPNGRGMPSQRHWLMISEPGDDNIVPCPKNNRIAPLDGNAAEGPTNGGGADNVMAGAAIYVLYKLTCGCGESPTSGLVPQRVSREPGGHRAAVVFSSRLFGGIIGDQRCTGTRMRKSPDTMPWPAPFWTSARAYKAEALPPLACNGDAMCTASTFDDRPSSCSIPTARPSP